VAERGNSMPYSGHRFGAWNLGVFGLQAGMLVSAQMRLFSVLLGHAMRVRRAVGELGRSLS
jgi:hypothetical protein